MNWSVSEAKARLSEVIAKAKRSPQVIENRGEEVAVVLSKSEFDRMLAASAVPQKTGIEKWLDYTEKLKAEGELNLEIPARDREDFWGKRPIPFSEDDE